MVLTDYIRDHDLGAEGPRETETLGAWPIHPHLVERLPEALAGRAALLTNELVGEVDNPRYLTVRRDRALGYERRDYHPVRLVLGVRKGRASLLHQAWRRRVGPGELVYTRAAENRGLLLQARARSFATAARRAAQRLDRWT